MSLVDIASQFGLVECINAINVRSAVVTEQQYKNIIVVDFEATCWEKADVKWQKPEIIEFPAILMSLQERKILAEFRHFVMPVEAPVLSDFCTRLTGIEQTQCDDGAPLQTVLMLFNKWLKTQCADHRLVLPKTSATNKLGNTALVSWSDWDFGVCLHKECERKRLQKPPYFDQWIDLRAIYKEWYKYRPKNFADALMHVGMLFEGREHSGIDDARNIARLAVRMAKDGATLAITKDLKPFMLFNKLF